MFFKKMCRFCSIVKLFLKNCLQFSYFSESISKRYFFLRMDIQVAYIFSVTYLSQSLKLIIFRYLTGQTSFLVIFSLGCLIYYSTKLFKNYSLRQNKHRCLFKNI